MKVINATNTILPVRIVLANGVKDSINLQPKARASLPPGSKVDPDFERQYASSIKIYSEASDSVAAPTENV